MVNNEVCTHIHDMNLLLVSLTGAFGHTRFPATESAIKTKSCFKFLCLELDFKSTANCTNSKAKKKRGKKTAQP